MSTSLVSNISKTTDILKTFKIDITSVIYLANHNFANLISVAVNMCLQYSDQANIRNEYSDPVAKLLRKSSQNFIIFNFFMNNLKKFAGLIDNCKYFIYILLF